MMWKQFDFRDIEQTEAFDRFVKGHGSGHFMQTSAWAGVKPLWDWRGIAVYGSDGGMIAAVGVLIRPLPLGFSLLYAPRGPVCDRNDPAVWKELLEALKGLARECGALLLHMDPDEADSNSHFRAMMQDMGFAEKSDEGFGNIQPQYVFRLSLKDRSESDIFQAFSQKTRYNIGLSLRKGITLREFSGSEDIPDGVLDDFYDLMQTTGQRDHFYIRSRSYFAGLLRALQADARLFVAYLNGTPIAGSIEIFCGKKAWYLYGASANAFRNAMPNYLLQWVMIQRALARDCELYDFRGVPGHVTEADPLYGLYRFKKGFSGDYVKFTGLFTYRFRPLLCGLLDAAMEIRRRLRPRTRN